MSGSSPYLYFDDTNPGLVYSANWFDNTDIEGVFNNTLSSTTTVGATVTVDFIASQIVIIGATVAPPNAKKDSGPISSYVLDKSSNSAFFYQANVTNATAVTFFNSGPLTKGRHSLQISVLSIEQSVPFLLDAVAINQPEDVPTTTTAVWVSTVFVTPSSVPSSALDRNGAASDSQLLPVAAIVGGVVGGVALLVSAALAFYFLYWRKRHQDYGYHGFSGDAMFDTEKDRLTGTGDRPSRVDSSQIEPFLAATLSVPYSDTSPSGTPHASEFNSSASGSLAASAVAAAGGVGGVAAHHTYPPTPGSSSAASGTGTRRTLSVVNDTEGVALTPAQRKAAEAKRQSQLSPQEVQFHSDSGVRFDSEGRPIDSHGESSSGSGAVADVQPLADVPPEYSER